MFTLHETFEFMKYQRTKIYDKWQRQLIMNHQENICTIRYSKLIRRDIKYIILKNADE